jgi:hypothetical protein
MLVWWIVPTKNPEASAPGSLRYLRLDPVHPVLTTTMRTPCATLIAIGRTAARVNGFIAAIHEPM